MRDPSAAGTARVAAAAEIVQGLRFGKSMSRWFEHSGTKVVVGKAGLTDNALSALPDALEDLIGDLLQEADEFDEEADDITSAWGDNLNQAGWGISDGPISNFSAKGKTGNDLPNSSEMTGRLLADFGAEVIKIEDRIRIDTPRRLPIYKDEPARSYGDEEGDSDLLGIFEAGREADGGAVAGHGRCSFARLPPDRPRPARSLLVQRMKRRCVLGRRPLNLQITCGANGLLLPLADHSDVVAFSKHFEEAGQIAHRRFIDSRERRAGEGRLTRPRF